MTITLLTYCTNNNLRNNINKTKFRHHQMRVRTNIKGKIKATSIDIHQLQFIELN